MQVCGDEVANGKPSPDTFIEAAKKLGLSEQDFKHCLVIEDALSGVQVRTTGQPYCMCHAALTHSTLMIQPALGHKKDALQTLEPLIFLACFRRFKPA